MTLPTIKTHQIKRRRLQSSPTLQSVSLLGKAWLQPLLLFGNFQLIALEPSSGALDSVKRQRRTLASLWHDPEDTVDSRFKNLQYESGQSIVQEFLVVPDIDY